MSGKRGTRPDSVRRAASSNRQPAIGQMRLKHLSNMFRLAGMASLPILMAADALLGNAAWAQARVAATALPSTPKTEYGSTVSYAVNGNNATITQTAAANIVSWKSFDIGSAAKVTIVQPSSTSVLLNKVSGGAYLNQTTIDGMLNANGRVYIYNPNGIVFGKTGQVNVNTLIASSLKFDESRVIGGLLQAGALPVLGADAAFAGGMPGAVTVESPSTDKAGLTVANGGLILLAAPNVVNNGRLSAPDGQVMLAAGSKVYLAAPQVGQTGTSLRGLLVEVSNDYAAGAGGAPAGTGTSLAENGLNGSISVARGNATMIAYAVNQKGIVSASTSVSLNGSIYLYARDQATRSDANAPFQASRTGQLLLGQGSVTQILPTLDDSATIASSLTFNKSDVKLNGANIVLEKDASIVAPGGNVTLKAQRLALNNPNNTVIDPAKDIVRVDLAAGSSIDVSGSSGTTLAMESNVITVDLRGTELADNVALRNSPLYGSKVQIDIRKGTAAANVAGWLGLVESNLGQLNAAGGSVSVSADGAIIERPGSKINVDGGWVDYRPGYVNTSKLTLNDSLVDIGSAVTNTLYGSVVNLPNGADNYETGYRQGSSAGTVKFSAPILVLQGALSGTATPGARQRDVAATGYPAGGQLQIGNVTDETVDAISGKAKTVMADQFGFAGKLVIGGSDTALALAPAANLPFDLSNVDQRLLASQLDLDTAALARVGFNRIAALTTGNIEVDAPVTLAAGGKLRLGAGQRASLNPDGSISAGGNISFNAPVSIAAGSLTAAASGTLQVADGVAFDLAGRWTNDQSSTGAVLDANGNPSSALTQNGGALNLSASQLNLGKNVSADVSAGAWLNAGSKVTEGAAGSVTLQADLIDPLVPSSAALTIDSGLTLSGYGFGSGGKLKLVGRNVTIGPTVTGGNVNDVALSVDFFQSGGFASYDIGAYGNLAVAANTVVMPRASSWKLGAAAATTASGAMATAAAPLLYALNGAGRTRSAANLTLRALAQLTDGAGTLTVNKGAQLMMDPGASLNLFAGRQLTEYGTLSAPGGHIVLGLTPNSGVADFLAQRSIWFGPNAKVLANGSAQRLYVSADGVASGAMLDGGSIQIGNMAAGVLTSADGYIVAESGSLFSANGASAGTLQLKSGYGVTPLQTLASNGGSIEIRAREGLLFDGTLTGGSGGASTSGGSLTVALDTDNQGNSSYPAQPRILTISTNAPAGGIVPAKLLPGNAIVADRGGDFGWLLTGFATGAGARRAGQGWLLASSFANGGFGRITFKSQDVLSFGLGSASLALSARDALILDAPNLRADTLSSSTAKMSANAYSLSLSAPYIQLGGADLRYQSPQAAVSGNATLSVSAGTLDLIGNTSLQGFKQASLAASADIRLVGMPGTDGNGNSTGYAPGSLSMVGKLSLTDAQTYPTTLSDFALRAASDASDASGSGSLSFASNGHAPGPVLSAGGSLTGIASTIFQGGQVLAPFGAITLGNLDSVADPILTSSVEYLNGSLTSVAGNGLVPFGTVSNGGVATASTWQYSLSDGTLVSFKLNPVAGGSVPERALPAKAIVSRAQSVAVDGGAVLDLAGGGALFAYEFTPGKGGSQDVLSNNQPGSKAAVFAISPNFKGGVAPIDASYGSDGGLAPGDSVYLSAMPGLPAGLYTLLPAHYALLPGAFSIKVAGNTRDMQPSSNITLQDGTMLVSGHLAESGSGTINARSSGFIVASGTVLRTQSEFASYEAATYFKAKAGAAGVAVPELPTDGGRIAFQAGVTGSAALTLNGSISLGAAAGGRSGEFDVSAPKIEIVANGSQNTGNAVQLRADYLTAMGADSIVIGALRDARADGVHLDGLARDVTLSNDAQHALSAPEIILAASDKVSLAAGASLASAGVLARSSPQLMLKGNGALLLVSSGGPVALTRSAVSGTGGSLDIAGGASVAAGGAAYLDATGSAGMNGQLNLAAGSALGIGAAGIDLGSELPAAASGSRLQFGTAALARFGTLSELDFNSYASTVNLYGNVNLGGPAMHTLAFKGAGIEGFGKLRQVTFTADTVRLDGSAGAAAGTTASAPAGTLNLLADQIDIGSGTFAIGGYADTVLTARSQLRATGTGGQLTADQNLTLAAGRIDTASGADATFMAGATLALKQAAASKAAALAPGLGGKLSFGATDIVSDAIIDAPSGQVTMLAANSINITGGSIAAAGATLDLGSTAAYGAGGRIELDSGVVVVGKAALLDVSAVGAAGGTLAITAANSAGNGYAQFDGTLKGGAAAGIDGLTPAQGQFVLNADRVDLAGADAAFGALNVKLNDAGFTESRQFEFHQGSVALGVSATAHQFTLAVDNGNITLGAGAVIDASGAKGGSIELYASQSAADGIDGRVTLSGSAKLLANGTGKPDSAAGSIGNGGRVVIGTSSADGAEPSKGGSSVHLDGASIDVSGSSAERTGTLTLRAPRINGGTDVAIAALNVSLSANAATVVEAYQVYSANTISADAGSATNLDAGTSGAMYADAASFIGNKAGILARLGGDPSLSLRPGIEVRAPGNLTVSVNEFAANAAERGWDLGAWRFDGAPVALTLRAHGDLNILGSISDGFIKPDTAELGMPNWQLDSSASASYRLAGGANLGAANPLAVVAGAGDVLFGFADRTPTSAAPLTASDAPVALVRTGTGRIDVAAGRDVNLALAKFFVTHSGDVATDGTPVIYDSLNSDGSYKVSLYGATVYTAGKAGSADAGFVAPQNELNVHYGAAPNTLSDATFSSGGGAITMFAGRNITGPQNLSASWFYRNNDGQEAIPADTTTKPATAAVPGVPGTKVMLPAAMPLLVNNWLFRQGRSYIDANGNILFEQLGNGQTLNTAWWSRFDYFNQGVATFGGGDINVSAAGKVTDLAVSVASNAYMPGAGPGALVERGGGDLSLRAGGDLLGGAFYVQKGNATLRADASIGAGNYVPAGAATTPALNPVLALGDASFDVSAGLNLAIEAAYNPMLTEQSVHNVVAGDQRFGAIYGVGGGGARWDVTDVTQDSLDYRQKYAQFSNFSTYAGSSAVHLSAIGGDLGLSNNAAALALAGGNDIANQLGTSFTNLYLLEPATFGATALSGNLSSSNGFVLSPAARGQLDLLAAGTMFLNDGVSGSIRMLDNDPNTASSSSAPRVFSQTDLNLLTGSASSIASHVLGGLHAGDAQSVHIIVKNGDIVGDGSSASTVSLAKAAEIRAGRDIIDLGFNIQQNDVTDVSSVTAGRDFINTTQSRGAGAEPNPIANIVTGPGRIDMNAGRNVDFGNASGLVTRGNLDNPFLPEGGASINVLAGGGQADYAALVRFANQYGVVGDVSPTLANLTLKTMSVAEQNNVIAYVRSVVPDAAPDLKPDKALALFLALPSEKQNAFLTADLRALIAFVHDRVPALRANISAQDAWDAFRGLTAADQRLFLSAHQAVADRLATSAAQFDNALAKQDQPLLNARFFSSLVDYSKASKLNDFDHLIVSLYPAAAKAQVGNIALYNSQLKTEQGGSIDLFAPGGSVYAGLTVGVAASQASKQGIFTIRGGAIRSLVKNDFLVNQGRVFTLGGGDIALVSQYGNIDAGKGAKTASSAPPPLITIDSNGNIKVDVSGSISGSGIATLKTHADQADSNVYAVAPRGIFDAGDAGVRSTGSVEINAPLVLNGANISAGGSIAGSAVAVAAPSIGSVATPASAAAKSDDVAKTLGNADPAAKSASLAVEVLGYGEGGDADKAPAVDDDKDDAETKNKKKRNKQQQPT